jgi:hypothetical protein
MVIESQSTTEGTMATKKPKTAAIASTTSIDEPESVPLATPIDLTETQGLPEATGSHIKVPSLAKASLFASPEAKKTLTKHNAWVTAALGEDASTVFTNATATLHSGRRTQRIGATYDRSCEDHQPGLFTAATGARESPDPKTQFWPLAPFATA